MNYNFSYDRQEDASEPSEDAKEGQYDGYRERELPQEYTPYCNEVVAAESDYDRYEYDHRESPNDQRRKENSCGKLRSCFSDMGRLTSSVIHSTLS